MRDSSDAFANPRPPRPLRGMVKTVWVVCLVMLLLIAAAYWLSPRGRGGRAAGTRQTAAAMQTILDHARGYAIDFENRFPPHLASLVLRGLKTSTLVDTSAGTLPLPQPGIGPPESWEKLAPALDAHCDFIYVGAGIRASDPSAIILLYTKPAAIPDGRMIGFVDGHAEFVRNQDLFGVFSHNNTLRQQAGRPPITLDKSEPPKDPQIR